MRVVAASLVLVAACGYNPGRVTPDDGAAGDTTGDTTVTTDTPVDMPITPGPCNDTGSADVRLCLRFEGGIDDESPHNNSTIATGHSFVAAMDGQGVVTTGADILVLDDDSLDVSNLTIRATIRPNALPLAQRQGLIDNGAFRLHVLIGGTIRCVVTATNGVNQEVITNVPIGAAVFTRVTCTYDGSQLRVYYDGAFRSAFMTAVAIRQNTTNVTIGQSEPLDPAERFDGVIDTLEVFGSIEAP